MRARLLLPASLVAVVFGTGLFFFSAQARGAGTVVPAATPSTQSTIPNANPNGTATTTPTTTPNTTGATRIPEPTVSIPPRLAGEGRTLFVQNCSSCHGVNAEGSIRAPNLVGLGSATIDFWVSTGRMPLATPEAQATIKPPRFNERQTHSIAAYVNSLAPPTGPGIPKLDLAMANEAAGANLFALNCAGCHTITAVGDALSAGTFAPSLYQASPTQVAEAVRIGPGQMPRFGAQVISFKQLNDLARYVSYLHSPSDPGGFPLGHVGPVTEGFVALLIGLGGLMLVCYWIGDRNRA